jgi:hypothetical protein
VRSCIEGRQRVPGLKPGHYKGYCEFGAGVEEIKDWIHNTCGCGTLGSVGLRSGMRKNGSERPPLQIQRRPPPPDGGKQKAAATKTHNKRFGAKMFWGSKADFSLRIAGASGRSDPRIGCSRFSWVGANII